MSTNKISGNTYLVLNRESSRIITTPLEEVVVEKKEVVVARRSLKTVIEC